MASRMDRYKKENAEIEGSRLTKNNELYTDFSQNAKYTGYSDIVNTTAIDLTGIKDAPRTRETYQKTKDVERAFDNVNIIENSALNETLDEEKVYDINSVLESAKKNRQQQDELEKKRKLRNAEYNILTSIEKKHQEQKEAVLKKDDSGLDPDESENLKEIINTICDSPITNKIKEATEAIQKIDDTTTELEDITEEIEEETKELEDTVNDIDTSDLKPVIGTKQDADLLSELMPSSNTETVITEEISKAIIAKELKENPVEEDDDEDTRFKEKSVDKSFYTKSMDLSDADFSEEDTEFVEKGNPFLLFIKVFLAIVLILGIGILIFFLINQM